MKMSTTDAGNKQTELFQASHAGNQCMVLQLLQQGVNPNPTNSQECPLHVAATVAVAKTLLEYGADLEHPRLPPQSFCGAEPATPLLSLLWSRNGTVATCLLEHGANPNVCDSSIQCTPLHWAVSRYQDKWVQILLSHGANVDSKSFASHSGDTPLHTASRKGTPMIVERLLQHGANVEATNDCQETPLCVVANDPVTAQLLLDAGANPNTRDGNKQPLLHRLCSYQADYSGVAAVLLQGGADPNIRWNNHKTPLHTAIENMYSSKDGEIQHLLRWASVDAADVRGQTPLHHATIKRKPKLIQHLLDHRANPNVIDKDGLTPLLCGTMEGSTGLLVQPLLDADANLAATDQCGRTALSLAAGMGKTELVELFLQQKAQLDKADKGGKNPLHWAVLSRRRSSGNCISLLVNHGAKLDARDKKGMSPLFYCAKMGKKDMVRLLLLKGAAFYL